MSVIAFYNGFEDEEAGACKIAMFNRFAIFNLVNGFSTRLN